MGKYGESTQEARRTVALDPADPAPGIQYAERRWLAERLPWPSEVPRGGRLVEWWAAMQEPFDPRYEAARQVPVMGGDGYRTEYPYHDRLTGTLWAYLRSAPDMRRLVVSARQDGHWWRGEERDVFLRVVNETERMREMGLDAYRVDALTKAREFLRRVKA